MSDGTGSIYRRGKVWWVDYSFRGERHRESSKSTRKKDAKKLLQKRMKEMAGGGPMVDEEDVTFADLREAVVSDYKINGRKSLDRVERAFDHLEDWFEGWRAVDLQAKAVRSYVAHRKEAGAANATINKELAALRRGLNLLKEDGILSRVPKIKALETNNVRRSFLTMADVEAVCQEISDALAPVVRFAALTGWRKGEILNLRWRHVDFTAGTIHLEPGTTKNAEGRTFPFDTYAPLAALLREQRERTDAVERREGRIVSHVFHRDGAPIKSMRGAWNGATDRAGIPDAWFHDLRRTAVRNLERAGVPRSVATKLTGHKTEAVYRRYAIADEAALQEGVEKLAAMHADTEAQEDRTAVPLRRAQEG